MLYVEAPGWRSCSQNPVYAVRNRLASLRAIFHIKSDSATFDNIAVPSGNRSSDCVLAACGMGPFSSGWHTTKYAREICQAIVVSKTPRFFSRSKRPVNLFYASFERAGNSPAVLAIAKSAKAGQSTSLSYQRICNRYVINAGIFFIFCRVIRGRLQQS
jgi:hypothetical protein